MLFRSSPYALLALLAAFLQFSPAVGSAQILTPLCNPTVTPPIIVDSHEQIIEAGLRAQPPVINTGGFGFAWPDTQMGAIKTAGGYEFFTSDGALHPPQTRLGRHVGNNKYGSVTTTTGTLDNPLGTGDPQDVSISPNPDPGVDPDLPNYGYMGGGSIYQVPAGMTGAGNLLVTYHAELPNYALLGLAESTDNGLHWTDLGEIIRLNQSYKPGLTFAEIGDGRLVLSPDGKFFYLYFPDLPATTNSTTQYRLRAHSRPPYFRPLSDPTYPAPFHSRSSTSAHGICSPRSAELPPTSVQPGSRNRVAISMFTSTAPCSVT